MVVGGDRAVSVHQLDAVVPKHAVDLFVVFDRGEVPRDRCALKGAAHHYLCGSGLDTIERQPGVAFHHLDAVGEPELRSHDLDEGTVDLENYVATSRPRRPPSRLRVVAICG